MNGKWVWINDQNNNDEYADFKTSFVCEKTEDTVISLSCDGNFVLYVNGELAGFGQYPDYPYYKIVEEIDITKFCKKGENELFITVWHYGLEVTSTYYPSIPGLVFSVASGTKVLAESGEDTLCRKNPYYKSGYMKLITGQLGLSFLYDSTASADVPFDKAIVVGKEADFFPRPIKMLELLSRAPVKLYADTARAGHYLIDLGRETVGFADLEFVSSKAQKIILTYGEHLSDGFDTSFVTANGSGNTGYSVLPVSVNTEFAENIVPRIIGGRDFSVEYIAKEGENLYLNAFRRLGLRWIEVFCEDEIDIKYIGIRPVIYPVEHKPAKVCGTGNDHIAQKIYDTSVYTLECCMHEHYEDCPWREQALYALDSRNQMLCGYYAFGEYRYPRANLILMAKGLRDDGLLSICAPTGFDLPIPSFSLAYIVAISEYIHYSGDRTIVDDESTGVMKALDSIMTRFYENIAENGIVKSFGSPCWDFYEWSPGSDGGGEYVILGSCFYIVAAERYLEITSGKGSAMVYDFDKIREEIRSRFYDKEKGLFRLAADGKMYSVLGNAFAVLAGVVEDKAEKLEIAVKMISGDGLVPVTLSMKTFYYDALLEIDEKYGEYIIDDIYKNYKHMLDNDATTFWETIIGAADFGNAGSLCHGWSAIPIYYYNKLGKILG